MKESVIIKISEDIVLYIKGNYTRGRDVLWSSFGESEPAEGSEFSIDEIESMNKDLFPLLDYISLIQGDYLEVLSELCINKIEE